jgi:Ca2+-binding RTX toxin-like protein
MAYPTLDYLTDLSLAARQQARQLNLSLSDANSQGWDYSAIVVRTDEYAILSDTYQVRMTEGAHYDIMTTSYFDPYLITVYDEDGNAVAADADSGTYGRDFLFDFVAPYTGTFYISAGWHQGSYYTTVTLSVYEDFPAGHPLSINDNLNGSRLFGGLGNDSITGTAGQDYLRGDDGDDIVGGGDAFDDLHGNAGRDTVSGGAGDDWVVGGKDDDLLKGEQGIDVVYGNLGNDTCEGGGGDDWVRGGQGLDILSGGSGNDWMSGDRDNDTLSGGEGADTFNFFAGAGTDRVTDFSQAQGDRVKIEMGSNYTISQVGSDAVVTLTSGDKLTLVGVQSSTLTEGWIFVG